MEYFRRAQPAAALVAEVVPTWTGTPELGGLDQTTAMLDF